MLSRTMTTSLFEFSFPDEAMMSNIRGRSSPDAGRRAGAAARVSREVEEDEEDEEEEEEEEEDSPKISRLRLSRQIRT